MRLRVLALGLGVGVMVYVNLRSHSHTEIFSRLGKGVKGSIKMTRFKSVCSGPFKLLRRREKTQVDENDNGEPAVSKSWNEKIAV